MNIDDIRRKLLSEGLSAEQAGAACGYMADYAMDAYKQGFERGCTEGHRWATRKKPEVHLASRPQKGKDR